MLSWIGFLSLEWSKYEYVVYTDYFGFHNVHNWTRQDKYYKVKQHMHTILRSSNHNSVCSTICSSKLGL